MPSRRWIPFAVLAPLYFFAIGWIGAHGPLGRGGIVLIGLYIAAHLLLAGLWRWWPFTRRTVPAILLMAVAARVLLFPFPLCDDMNRYVWEGKIQNAGYNPFALAPDAEALIPLRDANWEGINHKHLPAIYPPLAQLTFRCCHALHPDGRFFRGVFTLFDLLLLPVLFGIAARYGMARRHLLLYALNPLVLLFVAGEGHLDPLYIFFLMAAALAWMRGREGLSFLLLGASCMMKLIPVAFFPLMVRRRNWRKAWLCFVPFLLAIPFARGGVDLLEVPLNYAETFYYNAALFSILSSFLSNYTASAWCWAFFLLAAVFIFFLVPDLLRGFYLLAGAYLLCSPIVHPWYFLLIVPFLPFFRSFPWFLLLALAAATFFTRIHQYATGGWMDYPLARCIEYLPFAAAGLLLFLRGVRTGPRDYGKPRGLSVVIPALNEETRIEDCIRSVKAQDRLPEEIIVVDGGSLDETRDRARAMEGVEVVESAPGRGAQIALGVERASGDAVLILHADSRLEAGALRGVASALDEAPHAAGGALRSAYDEPSRRYAFIAFLDNARALCTGISFGNQGQFFRVKALEGGFPTFRLMEDVELAFRLKESGSVLFLGKGIRNQARRWARVGFLRNVAMVVGLVTRFIIQRRLDRLQGGLDDFYEKYYGRL
jgi:hypothetical protein